MSTEIGLDSLMGQLDGALMSLTTSLTELPPFLRFMCNSVLKSAEGGGTGGGAEEEDGEIPKKKKKKQRKTPLMEALIVHRVVVTVLRDPVANGLLSGQPSPSASSAFRMMGDVMSAAFGGRFRSTSKHLPKLQVRE